MKLSLYRRLLIFTFLLASISLKAQLNHLEWQTCFDLPGKEYISDIVPTSNGYLFLETYIIDYGQILLRKTTNTGELIWEKEYGGTLGDDGTKIIKTLDNNYLIIGGTASIDGDVTNNPYPGNFSFWLYKIDSTGNLLWDKVLGGLHKDVLMDGIITSDSGIVMMGWIEGGGGEITNYYGAG